MPLFVKLPLIVKVLEALIVREELVFTVILLQTASLLMTGLFVTLGIITSSAEVGITPSAQLVVVCQSVFVAPVQYLAMNKTPVVAVKKVVLILVAEEPVPPHEDETCFTPLKYKAPAV